MALIKKNILLALTIFIIGGQSGFAQQATNMKDQNNPLLCDPKVGICEIPALKQEPENKTEVNTDEKPVKVIYFTDPICSSCWGIEPQLRKLKLEYGHLLDVEYRMGGLLPDWSYNSGGISKPSDVAHHWDEVSVYYDMPIDGDVWLEDPLHSSFPPSIAFKAAQMQDTKKAVLFLRHIREIVFLQKKNITKWAYLEAAAKDAGLDIIKFKSDYEGKAKELFEEDLKLGKTLGVRGFPTMFFTDKEGKKEIVYGSKPYSAYENALFKLLPAASKTGYDKSWKSVFSLYPTLTAKEFAELSSTGRAESELLLNDLTTKGVLGKLTTKNGSLWKIKE
jgi:putative protein-disulfide isomerase